MGEQIIQAVLIMSVVSSSIAQRNKFQGLLKFVTNSPSGRNRPHAIKYDPDHIYTDYIYGDCTKNNETELRDSTRISYDQLKGKVIVRGWLDLFRIPSCIILRSTAFEEENYRATAFNFQICVARITYIYAQRTWRYYYYEWYIPHDMSGRVDWELFFYSNDERDP